MVVWWLDSDVTASDEDSGLPLYLLADKGVFGSWDNKGSQPNGSPSEQWDRFE